jgi:hypothetical protein
MPAIFSQGLSSPRGLSSSRFTRRQSTLEISSTASTSAGTHRSGGSNSSESTSYQYSKPPRHPKGKSTMFYSNNENTDAMDFQTMRSFCSTAEFRLNASSTRKDQVTPRKLPPPPRPARPPADPMEEEWGYFVDCADW